MIDSFFNAYPVAPYICIIILIILSAFFSGSEIAFAGVNERRLRKKTEDGSKRSIVALKIFESYENRALPSILVGNNLVNIASSSIATVIALKIFTGKSGMGTTIATVVMTVIILIFGEIIPKITASEDSVRFTEMVSYPLRLVIWIFTPIVVIVTFIINLLSKLWNKDDNNQGITEDELLTIIETVEDEGVIDEDKSELLQSAIEFDDITVREVLTPRVDMFAVDIDDEKDIIIEKLLDCSFSRIPVYEDTTDNIIGIIYLNEILKSIIDEGTDKLDIRSFLHEPIFFHQSMKLDNVLEEFQSKQFHMAIVTDEYGGTMGIVTLEDVVEEIVGDIWDEKDTITTDSLEIKDNLYEINGDLAIFDFCDMFELSEESIDCDCVTVGGLAIEMLDGYPNPGDEFEINNLLVTIKQMDEMRVKKLTVKVNEKTEDDEEI